MIAESVSGEERPPLCDQEKADAPDGGDFSESAVFCGWTGQIQRMFRPHCCGRATHKSSGRSRPKNRLQGIADVRVRSYGKEVSFAIPRTAVAEEKKKKHG